MSTTETPKRGAHILKKIKGEQCVSAGCFGNGIAYNVAKDLKGADYLPVKDYVRKGADEEIFFKDGSSIATDINRNKRIKFPNGAIEIVMTNGHRTLRRPDGTEYRSGGLPAQRPSEPLETRSPGM